MLWYIDLYPVYLRLLASTKRELAPRPVFLSGEQYVVLTRNEYG